MNKELHDFRFLFTLLLLCLLALTVALTAGCGQTPAEEPESAPERQAVSGEAAEPTARPEETAAAGTELRLRSESIQLPEELDRAGYLALDGDRLYVLGTDVSGAPALYVREADGPWQALEADLLPAPAEDAASEGDEIDQAPPPFVAGLAADGGAVWAVVQAYDEDYLPFYTVTALDGTSGQVLSKSAADIGWLQGCAALDGRLLLHNGSAVQVYDRDGVLTGTTEAGILSLAAADGRMLAFTQAEGSEDITLCQVNMEDAALTELCTLSEGKPEIGYTSQSGAFVAGTDSLWRLDPETGEAAYQLDWADNGVSLFWGANSLCVGAQGEMFLLASGELLHMTPYQGQTRQALRLALAQGGGGTYIDQAVAIFNRSSEDYVVKMESYSLEDMQKLLADTAMGRGPDILSLGADHWENAFTSLTLRSSLCEDLLPYLDSDPDFSRESFVPGTLDAMMERGGLYRLIIGFQPYCLQIPAELAEEAESWTADALLDMQAELPAGVSLFDIHHQMYAEDAVLHLASAGYVDRENAVCSFDDPSFVRWLEYWGCATDEALAAAESARFGLGAVSGGIPQRLREMFGGDYAYVGIPGKDGPVRFLQELDSFSILSTSQNKEAAWAFLRCFLLPEVQTGTVTSFKFPIIEASFDQYARKLMGPGSYTTFTQEDADRIKAFAAESVSFSRVGQITDMVKAEAEKAFAGQSSFEDAAKRIQSSVSLYLAEQYG